MVTLLREALDRRIEVEEDGRRRKCSKHQLGLARLADKFAAADPQRGNYSAAARSCLPICVAYSAEQKMNTRTADGAVQWLFVDLNAFFASCERQGNPALRGKPVIVVQTPAEGAVAIAASCAAKAFGITTGTPGAVGTAPVPRGHPGAGQSSALARRSTPASRSRRSCRSTRWRAG
jgi:hypothetical protein